VPAAIRSSVRRSGGTATDVTRMPRRPRRSHPDRASRGRAGPGRP
jgi:hypothetical protein